MIWCKNRDTAGKHWYVYHKGLNGGTNPEQYSLKLNTSGDEGTDSLSWNQTAPTSTHFTLGSSSHININNDNHIAMLFASVDGISKVGYFDGSDSEQTITTGFQPRFLLLKCSSDTSLDWYIFDTTRGWGSGNDQAIWLTNTAQWGTSNYGTPNATGFTLTGNIGGTNDASKKYIYYAHA